MTVRATAASKADSAQGGWVLVPRVPTDDMLRAAYPLHWFDGPGQRLKQDYQTMLAAAPTPVQPRREVTDDEVTRAWDAYYSNQESMRAALESFANGGDGDG